MRMGGPAKEFNEHARRGASTGPQAAFLGAVAVAGAIVASGLLPTNLLMPAISTLLFVLALVFALVAWVRCSTDEYHVSYWDVAGALLLIGVGAAALIEPDQLTRLVSTVHTD